MAADENPAAETVSDLGMVRVAACSPALRVADVAFNGRATQESMRRAAEAGAALVVFPELGITGYTCADLFYDAALLDACEAETLRIAHVAERLGAIAVVGVPVREGGRIYNCAAVLADGRIAGLVPKTHLPNSGEYYEARWFASSGEGRHLEAVRFAAREVPFGTDLIFACQDFPALRLGVEICEDLWSVEPPSGQMALAGANVIANLSASNELIGKAAYRRDLVKGQSARCLAAYLYAAAGAGESSSDTVFSGHSMIAETGVVLVEAERFSLDSTEVVADVDLERIEALRQMSSAFARSGAEGLKRRVIPVGAPRVGSARMPAIRPLPAHPFIPDDAARRAEHCREIFAIQAAGLAKRLLHTGCQKAVLGVSGGLDSALALLVCAEAAKRIGRGPDMVEAVVMPGPGSTRRTQENARRLASAIACGCREIPIGDAVERHLADIGHSGAHDIAFENAQARERTQVLMDLANASGGLVVGTGDLSEAALGWCTFNGDHMSMYHVNAGVPKTLVRHLVAWCAEEVFSGEAAAVLRDICDTPITPELLPAGEDGTPGQRTEDTIGPYELHDFFLFHFARNRSRPHKLAALARQAFGEKYAPGEIRRVLEIFLRRFFAAQFKRQSMPDGPKVGTVALSPRADWRMPSDAVPDVWLSARENLF